MIVPCSQSQVPSTARSLPATHHSLLAPPMLAWRSRRVLMAVAEPVLQTQGQTLSLSSSSPASPVEAGQPDGAGDVGDFKCPAVEDGVHPGEGHVAQVDAAQGGARGHGWPVQPAIRAVALQVRELWGAAEGEQEGRHAEEEAGWQGVHLQIK